MVERSEWALHLRTLMSSSAHLALVLGISAALAGEAAAQARPDEGMAASDAAPDADENLDIIVTGTSLRGIAPVGTTPLTLGAADIRQIAPTSTIDLLRTVPQINNLGSDETRAQGSQGASQNNLKGAALNLRGLGPGATLMLVNGRRVQPNGTITAFYDPNVIPAAAISRVEILVDGASSIYGSDAVGGVVNLITKRDYDGMEFSARYGWANGWNQMIVSGSAGKRWDTGSISISAELNERSSMDSAASRFVTQDFRPFGGPDRRTTFSAPGTILVDGVRYAIPAGQDGRNLTPEQLTRGANLYDAIRNSEYLPQQTRYGGTLNVTQNIGPVELSWDSFYSRRTFEVFMTGNGQGTNNATIRVPNTNPWFVSPVPGKTSVTVEYQLQLVRPVTTDGFTEDWGSALGAKADLFGDWSVDAFASYSLSRAATGFNVFLNAPLLLERAADPNPATAFNPFCDPTAFTCNSDAVLNSFLGDRRTTSRISAWQYVAKINGSLFDLPGGAVKLALGVEYYDSKFHYYNAATNNPTNQLLTVKDINMTRDVKSAFAELAAPLIDMLTLSASVRVDDYSDFGTTTNPRFGATFEPIGGLSFRASYSTSFRAPALTEKSDAGTGFFIENVNDPSAPGGLTRALYATGGNPNLGPETAKSWSVGFDVKPQLLPGFSASLSYYNVRYRNLIRNLVGFHNIVLGQPNTYGFAITRNPSAAFLAPFMSSPYLQTAPEDPANIAAFLDLRSQNLGALKQDGIDFSANYQRELGAGVALIGVSGTKTFNLETQNIPGGPFIDTLGKFGTLVSFNMRGTLGWQSERFGANLYVNHIGSYTNDAGVPGVPLDTKVPGWTTFDASVRFSLSNEGPGRGLSLTVSARNLFDRDPPVVLNGFLPFDSQNANIFGRIMSVELRKTF